MATVGVLYSRSVTPRRPSCACTSTSVSCQESPMGQQTPFRFGVIGAGTSRAAWVSFARKAEALGYSTLVVGDHLSVGGLGPIASLMAAADATTALRLSS